MTVEIRDGTNLSTKANPFSFPPSLEWVFFFNHNSIQRVRLAMLHFLLYHVSRNDIINIVIKSNSAHDIIRYLGYK